MRTFAALPASMVLAGVVDSETESVVEFFLERERAER
jgi:hypothetical protein